MKIIDFDIKKGVFSFEFNDLITENHSHPVVEIISSVKGSFSVEIGNEIKEDLIFAIIDSNKKHRIISHNSTIRILMLESFNSNLSDFFKSCQIIFKDGFFSKPNHSERDNIIEKIKYFAQSNDLKTPLDFRINDSIKFIEENELEYKNLITVLTENVFLSHSRLSHLFKEHTGVSIKKYLVWNKLKQAIILYLNDTTNFTDVSIMSGFFDQAHLGNSFKKILGVSPAKIYNSRILQ